MVDDSDFDAFLRKVAKAPDASVPEPRRKAGERVGPFEILDFIADGGMGAVYRAADVSTGRLAALKLIREVRSDEDIERFRREAKLLASIDAPHVVHVLGFELRDQPLWLALELLEGRTLRERLAAGPIPDDEALRVASGILRGLAATHQAGIVHRDLKPGNVFLLSSGETKLLDFGLAKRPQSDGSETMRRLTHQGALLGTPHYMSPEQARGQPTDERSDIFSVGTVCYEMLHGKHPFAEKSTLATLNAVAARRPTLFSRDAAGVAPSLRKWLERCMEKDPEKRFSSAELALEALGASQ